MDAFGQIWESQIKLSRREKTLFIFCVQPSWPQDNCQGEKGKQKGHNSREYKNELQFCKF